MRFVGSGVFSTVLPLGFFCILAPVGVTRVIAHFASRPRSLIQCLSLLPRLYFKPLFSNVSSPFVNLMLVSFTTLG